MFEFSALVQTDLFPLVFDLGYGVERPKLPEPWLATVGVDRPTRDCNDFQKQTFVRAVNQTV
jgi:hypothetical protein